MNNMYRDHRDNALNIMILFYCSIIACHYGDVKSTYLKMRKDRVTRLGEIHSIWGAKSTTPPAHVYKLSTSHNRLTGCERTLHTTLIDHLPLLEFKPILCGHTQLHRDQNALAIFAIADALTRAPQKSDPVRTEIGRFPRTCGRSPTQALPSQWTVLVTT